MNECEQFEVQLHDAGDGSGDVFIPLTADILNRTGMAIGDVLTLEVVDGVAELHGAIEQPTRAHLTNRLQREEIQGDYRRRLTGYLQVPIDTSDQALHVLIEAGFTASLMQKLCLQDTIQPRQRDAIISARALSIRLSKNQRLSLDESDRLFRITHIIAMAEAIFGDTSKAKQWLSKPKVHLSGKSPNELVLTTPGTHRVEEMLIQVSEGFYS